MSRKQKLKKEVDFGCGEVLPAHLNSEFYRMELGLRGSYREES
jgi:hypothetical protein